jgi:large subunit ribosomal protein L18
MAKVKINRENNIKKRETRVRGKLRQISHLPRLSVFRSNKLIYAQIINDGTNTTLACAKGKDPKTVGEEIAKTAIKAGVLKVAFDRGSYNYHGRVKLLAEAAREAGLIF